MTFPIRFFISNIFISLLLGCFLLFKKVFKKHLTLRIQYDLWYFFVFALFLPFIPYRIFRPEGFFLLLQQLFSRNSLSAAVLKRSTALVPSLQTVGSNDFSTAAAASDSFLNKVLFGIWIAGMCCVSAYYLYTVLQIHSLKKESYRITEQDEPDLSRQYVSCLQELHIQKNVRLYASCNLSSPVSYGWIFPKIIIPQDLDIVLSPEEIRFVFLHELQHYRRKDAFLNDLVCLFQALYWFNPFLWYGFRQLCKDREIACDNSVIRVIGQEYRMDYGYTLLRYARQIKTGWFFSPLSNMGGGKDTIKQRITEIADYKKDSFLQKIKSLGILLLTILLIYCSSPLLMANASSNSRFHFTNANWNSIDVSSYFNGMNGSFVLYDMTMEQYQIYNREMSEQRIAPDSTFKIYSALFALEENLISPEDSLLKWDGTEQIFDAWNQNQTLNSAMKNSVNWYFQNLDNQLGLSALYSYYRKISYGNCDLSGGINDYWAESSLKISPIEQVLLLSGLLKNQWGFQEENINAVKNALFLDTISAGKLYGKTGTGSVNGQNVNGWFVGFLERHGHMYCFAANIQDTPSAVGSTASEITINILNHLF